ncbi:MAG: DUF4390 domain-containing protein [Candidatus Eisenbacteria bacterium]|uniref:DUF4390 domain-containing protein n=1 Tax=Eiseniibacteriota bacterium TaxID=2212470 RepID=A0A9D6L6B0_UNCEI|nr:DUF4390 domain-containing protein [Candidatus Eisenbacteria bacterium]
MPWPALALAALALAAARPALALDLVVSPAREKNGLVMVDVRLQDIFAPRIAESLSRGMPATVRMHAELWRRRSMWFDKMERSVDAEVRIRYDVWTDRYLLEREGADPIQSPSVDSVASVLSRPWALAVGRVGQLAPHARYYVAISTTLRPLTVEDLAEVEGWLSGEVADKRRAGFGLITEIPRSLFDAVRNVAGFGDQHARDYTPDFELKDLFAKR